MIYINENNWYEWNYGSGPTFGRQLDSAKLHFTCNKFDKPILSFKEELEKAASSTLDYSANLQPSIFFSGGVDSEMVLRSYLKIGANPKVYIVRYEHDYNIQDVSYAVTICSILNVKYSIIDFSLQQFYENDAEKISEISQIDRPRALPYCKFLELADGFPIMGEGDPHWVRLNANYSQKGEWRFRELETFIGWHKYAIHLDRPSVVQFFKWTPGLVLSHSKLKWFNRLVNDYYYGKLGTNSTKILGYREVYPELLDRKKQTGFEKIDHLIDEFELFLHKKYHGLPYRQSVDRTVNNLWKDVTGKTYNQEDI